MNWVDFTILGIMLISTLLSIWRGLIKEALSLVSWIVAVWVALNFSEAFSVYLTRWIDLPSARMAVAFTILFIVVLLLGSLVNYLASQFIQKTGLSGTDRILGSVFGVTRGVVIISVLVLLAGLTAVPMDPWWHDSLLLPYFEQLAIMIRDYFPDDIATYIEY